MPKKTPDETDKLRVWSAVNINDNWEAFNRPRLDGHSKCTKGVKGANVLEHDQPDNVP